MQLIAFLGLWQRKVAYLIMAKEEGDRDRQTDRRQTDRGKKEKDTRQAL